MSKKNLKDSAGYTGYTMQIVEVSEEEVYLFCMSPQPHKLLIDLIDDVADSMIDGATDSKNDWKYWYESTDWRFLR